MTKHINQTGFSYVAIRHNIEEYKRISTYLPSKVTNKKYAIFYYTVNKDSSEILTKIECSNDLDKLQAIADNYPSWYNYPMGYFKQLQGDIINRLSVTKP
jgi:hypothetical protein